jgi:hypothetical protein
MSFGSKDIDYQRMSAFFGPLCSINISLRAVGHEGVDWIQLAEDKVQWLALVKAVMDSVCNKGEEFLDELRDCHLLKVWLAVQTSTMYQIGL